METTQTNMGSTQLAAILVRICVASQSRRLEAKVLFRWTWHARFDRGHVAKEAESDAASLSGGQRACTFQE